MIASSREVAHVPVADSSSLYASVARGSLETLHFAVRGMHCGSGETRARGVFAVRQGSNAVARVLARLLRFPPESAATHVDLVIRRYEATELWVRSFNARPLRSEQRRVGNGLLAERFGPCEFRFRVSVSNGGLQMAQAGFALRLGPVAFPIARWLAPTASGWVCGGDVGARVSVTLALPLVGLLLAYEGSIREVS